MVLPTSSAFPPAGRARVDPQIEQAIEVDALSKIIASCPQSRQLTRRNFASPMIIPQSLLNEFKLLRTLRGRLVSLSGLGAAVE